MNSKRLGRALSGGLLVFGGAAGLAVTAYATFGHGSACQRLIFALGLPGSLVLSSLSQCSVIAGAWLLWLAFRSAKAAD